MPNKSKPQKRGTGAKQSGSKAVDLFAPIFALLIRAGYSKGEIDEICGQALIKATANQRGPKVFKIGDDYITADLIHRWLRDPKYINANGKPKELPVGGKSSFQNLVKESEPRANPHEVVHLLLKFGVVRRLENGNLRLIRRSLNFSIPDGLPFEPNFNFLLDAVRSCTRGLAQGRAAPKLYWHSADSKQIASKDTDAFLKFSEERSLSFMHEINDWLDQHASVAGGRAAAKPRRVGVGLFAVAAPGSPAGNKRKRKASK
jgi:hypothetical protein